MNKLLLLFGICVVAASCSTSKFDYQTAYRFKYQQQQEEEQHIYPQEPRYIPGQRRTGVPQEPALPAGRQDQGSQLQASLKPVAQISQSMPADNTLAGEEVSKSITPISKENFDAFSKTEKKAVRQQVKQDFKTLKKEYKKAENDAANQDIVFNKKMFIGVVIFAAGVLVAILASGPVGAIGIIVGIGLIAWGFIEQA